MFKKYRDKKPVYIIGTLLLFALMGLVMVVVSNHRHKENSFQWSQTSNVYQKLNDHKLKAGKYVIFFYKEGCPYCKKTIPVVKQELAKKDRNVTFYSVNSESETGKQIASDYSINDVPSMVSFQIKGNQKSVGEIHVYSISYDLQRQNPRHIEASSIGVKRDLIHDLLQGQEVVNG